MHSYSKSLHEFVTPVPAESVMPFVTANHFTSETIMFVNTTVLLCLWSLIQLSSLLLG